MTLGYQDLLWVATSDINDTVAVQAVVDRAFAELGHIDVIVNNAGYALFCAAEEAEDDQILQQINTNRIGEIFAVPLLVHFLSTVMEIKVYTP